MYSLLIILVGCVLDTLVRQAAMILKCILLMYFKNSRGRNYRKQVVCVDFMHLIHAFRFFMFCSYLKYKCSLIIVVLVLQGQLLTLIEYLLLLYRALLPAPVWYRFFLNKEYGSLFSSLMTGLYLTFKLTSVVEKVWFFTLVGKCATPQHRYFPPPFSDQNLDIVYYRFIVTMSPTLRSPCMGWCSPTSLWAVVRSNPSLLL